MTPSPPDPAESILINGLLISAEDIQLIAAESGINLNGGDLMIWKRNIVVTSTKRHVIRDTPRANASLFDQWIQLCPHAVAIRTDGSVLLPRITTSDNDDPIQILTTALKAVQRELATQLLRTFAAAGGLLVAAIFFIWFAVSYMIQHPNGPTGSRTVVFGIVLSVASLLLFIRGCTLLARRSRILRIIKNALSTGELQPELLASVLAPTPDPENPPAPPTPFVPAFLSIVALILMCFPFVGLLLSLISFALTFRKSYWPRTLSIISLIISTLATLYIIIMLIIAHH